MYIVYFYCDRCSGICYFVSFLSHWSLIGVCFMYMGTRHTPPSSTDVFVIFLGMRPHVVSKDQNGCFYVCIFDL